MSLVTAATARARDMARARVGLGAVVHSALLLSELAVAEPSDDWPCVLVCCRFPSAAVAERCMDPFAGEPPEKWGGCIVSPCVARAVTVAETALADGSAVTPMALAIALISDPLSAASIILRANGRIQQPDLLRMFDAVAVRAIGATNTASSHSARPADDRTFDLICRLTVSAARALDQADTARIRGDDAAAIRFDEAAEWFTTVQTDTVRRSTQPAVMLVHASATVDVQESLRQRWKRRHRDT